MPSVKRYTIADVAKKTGVSMTTISRYLNGQYQYMSKETKEKIRTVIGQYGYRPSLIAKGLKSDKSYLIGVVMPHVHTPMSSHSIRGICMACVNTQYDPIFVSIEDNIRNEPQRVSELLDHRVEGILCYTGSMHSCYKDVVKSGTPVVFVDRYEEGCGQDGVMINHYEAVQESLLNLFVSGYTKIAMFSTGEYIPIPTSTIKIREKSYADFAAKYLAGGEDLKYVIDENDTENIKRNILKFKNSFPDEKKAIFVPTMSAVYHVDWVCKLLGLKYPKDIAIYGYMIRGDISSISTELTTITQPQLEMSQQAFNLLIDRINGVDLPFPQKIVIPAEFNVRASTLPIE